MLGGPRYGLEKLIIDVLYWSSHITVETQHLRSGEFRYEGAAT
jgi:hypothetical protein